MRRQDPTAGPTSTATPRSSSSSTAQPQATTASATPIATWAPSAATATPTRLAATAAPPAATATPGPTPRPTLKEILEAGWVVHSDSPLHVAAVQGSAAEVEELLGDHSVEETAAITSRANENLTYRDMTPLHLAAGFTSDPEVVSVLLEWGSDIGAMSNFGIDEYTPLHLAAIFGTEPRVIEVLLEWGADVNALSGRRR